jgi:hypothetical protein
METLCALPVPGERRVIGGGRMAGRETNGMWRLKAELCLRTLVETRVCRNKFSIASIASCAVAWFVEERMTESSGQ